MQAMPAIQVDPTSAGVPAEAKTTASSVPDGQFSQHLETAGQDIAPTAGKGKAGRPVEAEDIDITAVADQKNDISEDLAALVGGDIQLVMAALQNQTVELPMLTSKGLNTSGDPERTQQNAQLQTLLDSIQIQGTSSQGQNGNKAVTTLAALLEKTIASSGNEKQLPVDSSLTSATGKPSSEPSTPAITIENWRAQFSYQSRTNLQDVNSTKPVPGQGPNVKDGGFREPVLAYVSPEVEKVAAPAQAKHGSGIDFPSQPRDANSNYIHSNLPGVNVKTEEKSSNKDGQQQNAEGQKNMAQDAVSQAEHAAAKSSQDTPLIFSLDQARAQGLWSQGQTTTNSLTLKLPSGTEVPHNQIVNQVIDRFTLNRTLESGSITMKLHPAELGELRMEIKVEQDNIKAHITTQNPQVQDILDRHLPRLREALEQQGLNLEQMTVTVGTDDGSNSQLFQEHFGSRQSGRSPRSNSGQVAFSLDQEDPGEAETIDGKQNLSVLI